MARSTLHVTSCAPESGAPSSDCRRFSCHTSGACDSCSYRERASGTFHCHTLVTCSASAEVSSAAVCCSENIRNRQLPFVLRPIPVRSSAGGRGSSCGYGVQDARRYLASLARGIAHPL